MNPVNVVAKAILIFGALVVAQLALSIACVGQPPPVARLGARVRVVALFAAAGLVVALFGGSPRVEAPLSLGWALTGFAIAAVGALRFGLRTVGRFDLADIAIDVGLAYLAVGGTWAFVYCADLSMLGFTGTKALLTANHFHFAGLGASVLVGGLARLRPSQHLAWRVPAFGTVFAVVLVALGITFNHTVEVAAAWTLAACVVLVAGSALAVAREAQHAVARVLLGVSALSGLAPAVLAAHFAWTGFARLDDAAFERMVIWHGLVNAVGFIGCGLVGVRLELGVRERARVRSSARPSP